MNTKTDSEMLEALGPSARAILLGELTTAPLSYCGGSDQLVALGLWDNDGCASDQCERIRARLETDCIVAR